MNWQGTEKLPPYAIEPVGAVSAAFREIGIRDFHSAARYVRALPYGRNTDKSNYRLVLEEQRGTCSTKHALLARLCEEHGQHEVLLVVGIYEMKESNTPGVGRVLEASSLPCVPEAHCYLKHGGAVFDLTREVEGGEPIHQVLAETVIAPDQIGAYKNSFHRSVMAAWLTERGMTRTTEELWTIREACIRALSDMR